jgi:MoaD family protein
MVKVLYFAELKTITGVSHEFFTLKKEKTIQELIGKLGKKYKKMRSILLSDDARNIKDSISVSINHSIINSSDPMTVKLENNDIIAFLLPVSGG